MVNLTVIDANDSKRLDMYSMKDGTWDVQTIQNMQLARFSVPIEVGLREVLKAFVSVENTKATLCITISELPQSKPNIELIYDMIGDGQTIMKYPTSVMFYKGGFKAWFKESSYAHEFPRAGLEIRRSLLRRYLSIGLGRS